MRSVDGATAFVTAKRIGHIAGDSEIALGKRRVKPRRINRCQGRKSLGTACDGGAISSKEGYAESGEHARAAVVGCATADTDDKAATAVPCGGVKDDLADTVGGRFQGISLFFGDKRNARCRRHLDDRRFRLGQNAVFRHDGIP